MKKIGSFIMCILPFLLFFGTVIPIFVFMYLDMVNPGTMDAMEGLMIFLVFLSFVTVIDVYGVMIWLIIKTVKNQRLSGVAKVIWCLCLYFFNIFIFPVYWFVYLRKE